MPRISPVAVLRSCAVAAVLVLASCSSGDDEIDAATSAQADNAATTTTEAPPAATGAEDDDGTSEPVATSDVAISDSAISTVAVDDAAPSTTEGFGAEVEVLCQAYLDSISFGTVDEGLATLNDTLGADAPPGVRDAIDTLQNPEGDIEGFFAAQTSLNDYVLPICRELFAASIVPASSNPEAADAFVAAVRDGDQSAAERVAPTNIIVSFDWNGFPDATSDFSSDDGTVSMLLEPTVTVYCKVADGAVESCAFGE